jgi:hypothetical protein
MLDCSGPNAEAVVGSSVISTFPRVTVGCAARRLAFCGQGSCGWQINGTTTIASGTPFSVTAGYDLNGDGYNND